ncbi:MAG: glycosyltransferase family 2 protein [Gluconobacter cerinus]|uniref:glycosyltransferase family 2 protein n=1 Tax=Gluconobacter cerinus TaxID=38307 RepID=UPI0039E7FCBE
MVPSSVAIALFVKNEFSDIAGWIAWHLGLGVKTLFIFDDHSTDGTWEIIQAAAKSFNIRAFQTDPVAEPDFYWRQRNCFMQAAEMAKGHYAWLGFLDGDEYVYFRHANSLPEFLERFPHADGLALSWRIQGSSGRVVRPRKMTVEAFTQHSTPELGDNVLVKSFVRPECMGDTYHNPHWFDVPAERYVRPNGQYVPSANAVQEIDWEDAFVLHYICRSMEHYIQRIKRRLNADLSDSLGYWDHFDRNDVEDFEPLRFIPKIRPIQVSINRNMVARAIEDLRKQYPPTVAISDYEGEILESRVFSIHSAYFETQLCVDASTGDVCHASPAVMSERSLLPVYGAVFADTPDLITFFVRDGVHVEHNRALKVFGDDRVFSELTYQIAKTIQDKPEGTALRTTLSGEYLCFILPHDGVGPVEANRRQAKDWEEASLRPEFNVTYSWQRMTAPLPTSGKMTFDSLITWLRNEKDAPSIYLFLKMIALLSPSDREKLHRHVPGLLWGFI